MCICHFKKFSGGYTPDPRFKEEDTESKRIEGGIRRNGRKERKMKGKGRRVRRGKGGRIVKAAWCPQTKILTTPLQVREYQQIFLRFQVPGTLPQVFALKNHGITLHNSR
jgi:hypothetical protein